MDMAQGLALALARSPTTPVCGFCRAQSGPRIRSGRMVCLGRLGSPRRQQGLPSSRCPKGRVHRSGAVCSAEADGFFESSVVKSEVDRLQADYQALLKMGRKYGQFDREGKKSYISEMKGVLERWQIFYKRLELSDDFTAKVCAKQLKSRGGPMGLSNLDLVQSLYSALDEMRADADGGQ